MLLDLFPSLTVGNHTPRSPQTPEYNCVAWALQNTRHFIWPDEDEQFAWPPDLPREDTVDAFRLFFERLGFEVCPGGDLRLQPGYEKIALYANAAGPQHVARQLPSGRWTSKFGDLVDAEHTEPSVLDGELYGRVVLAMKRQGYAPLALPQLHPPPARLIRPDGTPLIR